MPNKRKRSIGVFDSGFGGLHVLRALTRILPDYDFVYLGDTARAPYGARSPEIIYEFTRQAVDFLFARGCELVVLACNTASSEALRRLQQDHLPQYYPDKRVLGVLIPAAEEAVRCSRGRRIGVIATEATVRSKAYIREIGKLDDGADVYQQACPLLVPIIEAGEERGEILSLVLRKYLSRLKTKKIDTLVLGCTHYGILSRAIRREVGRDIRLISGASAVPNKLLDYLCRHPELESRLRRCGLRTFYTSDLSENFEKLGSRFYGQKIKVRRADLNV